MLLATIVFLAFLAVLFAGMVGFLALGHHLGLEQLDRHPELRGEGNTAIEAALFALLGLLVAFTISGGETRLNVRRELIIQEANAIGTAYLRLDLLPEPSQPALRAELREYVDARIHYYRTLLTFHEARAERRRIGELQDRVWKHAVVAANRAPDSRATLLLVPALNAMLDVTTAREAALRTHVPLALFVLLVLLAFACAFFAGLGMAKGRRPSRIHVLTFAGTLAVTAYVILNLEFPRAGFIGLGGMDALLAQVRASMN
jgi:hypothetical protein